MRASWRIELLGGLHARREDGLVAQFRSRKAASLLGRLAYRPDRCFTREELIAEFWPDDDLSTARHKLSVALSALRQALEPPGTVEGSVLSAGRHTVQLTTGAVEADVTLFRSALGQARQAAGPHERRAHLLAAVALYRGELLPGFYDSWILPEQQYISGVFIQAVHELVGLAEAEGDAPGAIEVALHAAGAEPLSEELACELLRLLLATARPAEALRFYQRLEERLACELDVKPSLAARKLAASARAAMLSHHPGPGQPEGSPEDTRIRCAAPDPPRGGFRRSPRSPAKSPCPPRRSVSTSSGRPGCGGGRPGISSPGMALVCCCRHARAAPVQLSASRSRSAKASSRSGVAGARPPPA
jgi:DNA-binding SARP family transcriptional activator